MSCLGCITEGCRTDQNSEEVIEVGDTHTPRSRMSSGDESWRCRLLEKKIYSPMSIPAANYVDFINFKPTQVAFSDLSKDKTIAVFALPGAYTPTCSNNHLPRFEILYDQLRANGIDEVYCLSVNDDFVMKAWMKADGVTKVKPLADGNAEIVKALGINLDKSALGFGTRCIRSSFVIRDNIILKQFVEPLIEGQDPYTVSDADTMLTYLLSTKGKQYVKPDVYTILGKTGCPFCARAQNLLKERGIEYAYLALDAPVQRVALLNGLCGGVANTVPQIWCNGEYVGGCDALAKKLGA